MIGENLGNDTPEQRLEFWRDEVKSLRYDLNRAEQKVKYWEEVVERKGPAAAFGNEQPRLSPRH